METLAIIRVRDGGGLDWDRAVETERSGQILKVVPTGFPDGVT